MIYTAVILAGGEGTRLSDVVKGSPKALVPVNGRPFLYYTLKTFEQLGFKTIHVLIRKNDYFEYSAALKEPILRGIRFIETKPDVNEAVCSLPLSQHEGFILLNGDCYPLMSPQEWRAFCTNPACKIAVNVLGHDVGLAMINLGLIQRGEVSCDKISEMNLPHFPILGGLHINDPRGLATAETFLRLM